MRRTVGLCVVLLLIAAVRFESKGQTSEVVTTNVDVKTSNSYPSPDRPTVQSCEVPIDAETKLPPDPYHHASSKRSNRTGNCITLAMQRKSGMPTPTRPTTPVVWTRHQGISCSHRSTKIATPFNNRLARWEACSRPCLRRTTLMSGI